MPNNKRTFRLRFLFQEFDLNQGDFIIGRSPLCNLTLEDPLVSRKHVCITVHDDNALLDDLGSRNGTLVNGEPIFDNYKLTHSDKIRIGAHDLIFIEEKRCVSARETPGGKTTVCYNCGVPFPRGASHCAACDYPLIPDNICMHCHTPALEDALYCSRCGTPLRSDDSTIPVELGGGPAGWTSQLINEVIEKALSARRYKQAARLIDGKIKEIEKSSKKEGADTDELAALFKFNLAVARGLKDSKRLKWVIDRFHLIAQPMSKSLLDEFEATASEWQEIGADLRKYLATFNSSNRDAADSVTFVTRMLEMIERLR